MMNKKELAEMEQLKTRLALRFTEVVNPDIPVPNINSELVKGFIFNAYSMSVNESCSLSFTHSIRQTEKTTTQGGITQFSTKKLAYQAMRNVVEIECAEKLRKIDRMIEGLDGEK